MRKNAADFAVFAFDKDYPHGFAGDYFRAFCLVKYVFYRYAFIKSLYGFVGDMSCCLYDVFFFKGGAWVSKFAREIAVVGKKDESAGKEVQPPDIIKAFFRGRKQLQRERASLRIA